MSSRIFRQKCKLEGKAKRRKRSSDGIGDIKSIISSKTKYSKCRRRHRRMITKLSKTVKLTSKVKIINKRKSKFDL